MVRDNGSDGNTGFHVLLHKCSINCWDWPENNHVSQISFEAGLKDVRLWELWLLMLIRWNLPWGPSDGEYRRHQLDEAMAHFFAINTEESPLFQEHCYGIAHDIEEGGVMLFPREKPLEQHVSAYTKQVSMFAKQKQAGGQAIADLEPVWLQLSKTYLWGHADYAEEVHITEVGALAECKDHGQAHSQIQ